MTLAAVSGVLARPAALSVSLVVLAPPYLRGGDVACETEESSLFFPDSYGLVHRQEIERARALCARCPVREACLAWAVPQTNLDGIWGGTTPPERRRARAKMKQGSETDHGVQEPAC